MDPPPTSSDLASAHSSSIFDSAVPSRCLTRLLRHYRWHERTATWSDLQLSMGSISPAIADDEHGMV